MKTEKPQIIHIMVNGDIKVIDADGLPLTELGPVTVRRVSRIVPVNLFKRAAFYLLRWTCGERGKAAAWTRTWHGPFRVRMFVGGAYTAKTRREAVEWEIKQVNERIENETGN